MPDKSATITLYPLGARMDLRSASPGLGRLGSILGRFCGLYAHPLQRHVVSAPAQCNGTGSSPSTASPAAMNASMRVSRIVLLTPSRASAAAATSSLSCSSSARKSSSVFANAGVGFSVVLLIFIGTGTPWLSKNALNFGALASMVRAASSSSTPSMSLIRMSASNLRRFSATSASSSMS